MSRICCGAVGAALLGLTFASPALAEDASAFPAPTLISSLLLTSASPPADNSKLGVNVASLPSDGVAVAPPPLPATSGLYFAADGSWQHFDLPRINLGLVNTTSVFATPPVTYAGPTASTNISASGYGVDLAAGYHLPPGLLSPAWGAMPRIELDFSMVDASQKLSTVVVPQVAPFAGVLGMMLNGTVINNGPICNVGVPGLSCPTNSAEASSYSTWHLGLKGASEFQFGMFTATPSLSVIGGEGENDIHVAQYQQQLVVGGPGITQNYAAHTKLNWDDVGGKAGLQLKVPLANTLTAALSGSVSLVDRETSLRGTDVFFFNVPIATQPNPFSTSVASSKNTAAFLANVEGSLNFQVMPAVSLRIFGGMNYDDSVPGVKAPVYFGSLFAPTGGSPARITFVSEISYYGGAGFVVHF